MKLTVKPKYFSLFLAFVILPLSTQAAENSSFEDSVETRAQRAVQENAVNNFAPQPQQQPRISRRQASNIAGNRYEGRVLSIMLDSSSNNWRVRMDQDGTVFNVFINASSGDVSASSE